MTCSRCSEDKTVTVTYGITLVHVESRTGRERTGKRETRLCRACGGGLAPDEVIA